MVTWDDRERDRHFARHEKAARKGMHLPSEDELLLGMVFLSNDAAKDLREFALRLAAKLRRKPRLRTAALLAALDEAVVQQDAAAVRAIEDAVVAHDNALSDKERSDGRLTGCALRCRIYLAHLADFRACAIVAGESAQLAQGPFVADGTDRLTLAARGLAWAALASRIARRESATGERFPYHPGGEVDRAEHDFHLVLVAAIEEENAGRAKARATSSRPTTAAPASPPPVPDTTAASDGVVVIPGVGNANTKYGKEIQAEFKGFIGVALPLPAMPDVQAVRKSLTGEFPWAVAIIDEVLGDLRGRKHVRLRPTVLVGPPGGGKTRFAKALMTACGLRWDLVPCGGVNDSWLGGTPRRWHSGEPSMPVTSVRRHGAAGPGLILDEVEKASVNRHNGALGDVLVGMLGRETGGRYYDPYIEAKCDISHVTWLMTANAVEPLQAPLRDRCRIMRFPEPGPEHLPGLAKRLLERHYAETGHNPRWPAPLEPYELDALAAAWPGGSVRKLERLVERLAQVRDGRLAEA